MKMGKASENDIDAAGDAMSVLNDMTDRELLELAAKAAGYEFNSPNGSADISSDGRRAWISPGIYWQPFDDDGDALRLAVKLGIERIFVLRLGPNGVCVDGAQEPQTVPVFEHSVYRVVFDQYAATRRAIVRAAAEIGKAMP